MILTSITALALATPLSSPPATAQGGNTQDAEALAAEKAESELRARALQIHFDALTLDTHKDIRPTLGRPPRARDEAGRAEELRRDDPTLWGPNQVDFPKMRAGGLDVAFYIVYVGQGPLDDDGFATARRIADQKFDAIERMCRRFPGHIELARTPDDVERIHAEGKLVACIGIENGYAMGTDLSAIADFHARGARYMSITHNRHSQLGDSNIPAEPLYGGLSELGRAAIEEMNRVGIMVDVSHASPTTTLQTIAHSRAPVIASHSSVDAIFEHPRNLSDEELRAIKENGGVVQCVAFASYVKDDGGRWPFIIEARKELGLPAPGGNQPVPDDPEVRKRMRELRDRVRAFDAKNARANVAQFVDHIDHAVQVAGIDHVAISSDFDGGGGIDGWDNAGETPNVTLELVRRGYTEAQIQQMWSGNTLRVWREVERVAREVQAEEDRIGPRVTLLRGGKRLAVELGLGEEVEIDAGPESAPAPSPGMLELNAEETLISPAAGESSGLWVVDGESGHRHLFQDVPGHEWAVVRSGDRSRLAWYSTEGGRTWLWSAYADGSMPVRLADATGARRAPSFSPDGAFLAFSTQRDGRTEEQAAPGPGAHVYVVPSSGGEVRRIGEGSDPLWLR